MEMQQIRYFLAAARELNFTRAAASCNVSQPSLTRAIGLLETELGGDLFRRERNLTHLTDLGQRMLPLLAQAVENADQAARLARSIRKGAVVSLRLALTEGVSIEPFMPQLVELPRAFPTFEAQVSRGSLDDSTRALKEGEVDMLLGPRPAEDWDRFDSRALFGRKLGIGMRADHPLARKEVVSPRDLSGVVLLHRPWCALAAGLAAHVEAEGVTPVAGPAFARDEDLVAYLATGPAVAFVPEDLAAAPQLVLRRFDGPDALQVVHATTVAGRQRSAALGLFLTQLRATDWNNAAA